MLIQACKMVSRQDQLVEQQTPTILQSEESSSILPTLPNDAASSAPSSGKTAQGVNHEQQNEIIAKVKLTGFCMPVT